MVALEEIEAALSEMTEGLGASWALRTGRGNAYGLTNAQFVQVSNRDRAISIRVWIFGEDMWLGAYLGVPYEASSEMHLSSIGDLVRIVRALCEGHFVREDQELRVVAGRLTIHLTEWPGELVDPLDPWGDGI